MGFPEKSRHFQERGERAPRGRGQAEGGGARRGLAAPDPVSALAGPQAWRGTLARWRCRRLRAVYTIMRWFRRHKVRAHLAELHRRFQAARQPPLYGRDLVWPPPPAVLQPFQDTCQMLFSRYLPQAGPHLPYSDSGPEHLDPVT